MSIVDVKAYAHLTEADVEALCRELDAIRACVEESLSEDDAAYIARVIAAQRHLEVAARFTLLGSAVPPAWLLGVVLLAASKTLQNGEISHHVFHGQWDWMNDPEIHSTTWEWDGPAPPELWKHVHNVLHHQFTNVVDHDPDVGYGVMRVRSDQPWRPQHLAQLLAHPVAAVIFEWGAGFYDIDVVAVLSGRKDLGQLKRQLRGSGSRILRHFAKEYLFFPALSGPSFLPTVAANFTAHLIRSTWLVGVSLCGHIPDGAETFSEEVLLEETKGEWYLRQMIGSANFEGSRLVQLLAGSLGYQIEHHLFPDLPSNRYPEIAVKVRQLAEKYDLPYATGPIVRQYGRALRKLMRLALP